MRRILYLGNAYAYQRPLGGPQPAQEPQQAALGQADAAGGRADGNVEEDRRAAARHDRVRVVVDHGEVAVLRGDPPQRLAAPAERGFRPARNVAERVVRSGRRILVPPVAAGETV